MPILVVGAETLGRNWWVVLLRGLAGIAFGVMTFLAPRLSLTALVFLFGAYALADGVLAIVSVVLRRAKGDRWGLLLLEGIVGIAIAAATMLWPGITALSLLFLIAGWLVATGALEIATAVALRKQITGEWLLALSGILSIAFGVLIFLLPGPGALAVLIWIGTYALVFGAVLVALALRLRSWSRMHPTHPLPHMG
jgi:uncharacterized membrane protein HdeD (DUF308 family)